MKKLLALVLALVMTLSLAVVGSNAAFKDADKVNETYSEAVNVLSGMKVFQGYTDGSFQPTGDITRAEVAAIVYRLYTGDVTDKQASLYATYNKFSDMDGAAWAKGYIGYCGNAGLIKGYDAKTFGPSDKVTGYQALAMILRAVGYDKNDEFTGAQWQLRVASTAQQLGILKNVKGVDLNAAATRELVAELLFRTAATVPMVKYTPAFGYVANTVVGAQKTLGEQNFTLKLTNDTQDAFGRPSHKWTYTTGNKSTTVAAKAAASYTTKVDECDIAKDLGITDSAKIEKAYIDGVSTAVTSATVTTDRNGAIDPKNTTSLVGAQGRITEVYDMGTAGYRIVEVNTYLAKVNKVTAATTDRNGHVTDATVNLTVYLSDATGVAFNGVEAEGFTVGQYVLVTVTRNTPNAVKSVVAATVTPVGVMKSWTPAYGTTAATTTLVDTKFNDADKFFVGNSKAVTNTSWDAITDANGNLIGLVRSAVNYLVIEKLEWKHDTTAIGNGKALANVALADGTKVTGVEIATVNTYPTSNLITTSASIARVADDYTNNTSYYEHIYTYSVNANGTYALNLYCVGSTNSHNTAETVFTTGKTSTIQNLGSAVVANDNTLFLVMDKNSDGTKAYSYTAYKGINELPSMTVASGKLCYLSSDNVFASLVVINDYTLASSNFVAYASAQNGFETGYNTGLYAYVVYVNGSTEPTTIYANHTGLITVDGFYEITKAANGVATVNPIMGAYGTGHTAAGTYGGKNTGVKAGNLLWDRGYIYAFDGSSLVNNDMNSDGTFGARYNTYRVNGDTKYFQVTKTTWNNAIGSGTTTQTEITASEAAALSAEDRIVVAYTSNSAYTENVATYVYVLKEVNIGQANPTQAATVKFQLQVMNGNVVEETVSLGYVEMSAGTATFTLANTSTQVDWNAGAPITKDARVTGLTLTGLRNPIVGTQQTVTVTADQYGSELPVVTFQLYR